MKKKNKSIKALVFSGGGAKGSYQIGVWKAIRELGMKFDIVTGSSIGSINAAMYAQNNYYLARKLWLTLKTDNLFDADIGGPGGYKEYLKLFDSILKNGGMSFNKAEKILKKYIDEVKIRKSKIDYGLVTYSVVNKTPKMMSKDKIPYGQLVDYIIASSTCFPAIEKKVIGDDAFIDGGFYDNLPINLAIDMGATDVLAVDLNAVGFTKRVKDKSINVDVIECRDPKKFTLSFSKDYALKMMQMGYNDTMKHFKILDGDNFTFKKNHILKNYQKIKPSYIDLLNNILLSEKKSKIVTELFNITKYRRIFNKIKNNESIEDIVLSSLEYLGEVFGLDKNNIYNIDHYNRLILKEVKNLNFLKLGKSLKGRMLIGYMYNKYMNSNNKEELYKELFNVALIFQNEFLATVYLIAISKKYPITLKSNLFYQEIYDLLKKEN